MNLVIVESPSKTKAIGKYLGSDYKVVSSKGHIRDLATTGKFGLGVDVENNFEPNYIPKYIALIQFLCLTLYHFFLLMSIKNCTKLSTNIFILLHINKF